MTSRMNNTIAALRRFEGRIAVKAFRRSKNQIELEDKLSKLFKRIALSMVRELKKPGALGMRDQVLAPLSGALTELDSLLLDATMREITQTTAGDLLRSRAFEASARTINRMREDISGLLERSYREGIGQDEAARLLRDSFDDMADYELKRIARTEINSAQQEANFEDLRGLDVQYLQWITAGDDRVRDGQNGKANHRILNGQIVRLGDPFQNGLKHPGDRSGRLDEWLNCRCSSVPFILPRGKTAPALPYFYERDLISIERAA